jgi:hypothetical protein
MLHRIHFRQYGRMLEITPIQSAADDRPSRIRGVSINPPYETDRDAPAYLRCLLISPCRDRCYHRSSESIAFVITDSELNWVVELLSVLLKCGTLKERCRAITILGQIGGQRAEHELVCSIDDRCPDVHWAAVAALKDLGRGDLLAEWNYGYPIRSDTGEEP